MRGVVHHLSTGLFGRSLALPDFPVQKQIVGTGLSDWDGYAHLLASKFSYVNTFFHQEPQLDIVRPGSSLFYKHDFLISTEVFEHIPPPVNRAFHGAFRLLKPGGLLVLTVPFQNVPLTVEHFPHLYEWKLVEFLGTYVVVNRTKSGAFEVHSKLTFHGGPGTTLEMRIFSRQDTIDLLKEAGFADIQVHGGTVPEWGIYPPHEWGLPITARKPPLR